MVWFKVDDGFAAHPKTVSAGNAALGLWVRAGSWCAQQLTDGLVPAGMVTMLGGKPKDAQALVAAGLWDVVPTGWQFHDWSALNPTREQVLADRGAAQARQTVARNPELREAVRARDRDCCRYCGRAVRWSDRRGDLGGTYDHVDPTGGTTYDNLVVCCRGCNSRKGRRTPAQAGMPLLGSDLSPTQVVTDPFAPPDPTRPDPTLLQQQQPGPKLLPPPVEILRARLDAAKLVVRWDTLTDFELADVEQLLIVHGDGPLVSSAMRQYRPDSPAAFAKAWLGGWRALPPPGRLAAVPDLCAHPDHHGQQLPCRLCRSEQLAGEA